MKLLKLDDFNVYIINFIVKKWKKKIINTDNSCCYVCNFNDMLSNGINCALIDTVKCPTCTVSTFEMVFSGQIMANYASRHTMVKSIRDETSILAQMTRKLCLEELNFKDAEPFILSDVLLKQTSYPLVVTVNFKYKVKKTHCCI